MRSRTARRILHVFGRMQRGGAELRTLELMKAVDQRLYHFDFCGLSGLPGVLDDEIRLLGGTVHLCKLGVSFPMRFRQLLRQNRYDVVHSHVHYFSGYILRLAAKESVPIRIAHFRNTSEQNAGSIKKVFQNKLMKRWLDKYATHILAVCEGAMSSVWGDNWRHDSRCEVIYNGIDETRYQIPIDREDVRREFGIPSEAKVCIHVGRMAEQKNHLRLLGIFRALVDKWPNSRLLLVGRGGNEIERKLRAKIVELNLEKVVVITGERQDVPRLLSASDLLIFPSLWEGLPGAVLEARLAGIPVLASDLPGIREIAQYLTEITILSLDEPDDVWAQTALNMLERTGSSVESWGNTPFAMPICVERFKRVWGDELSIAN